MDPTIIPSRLREPYVAITCAHCKAHLEYLPPPSTHPAPQASYVIQCHSCSKTFFPNSSPGGTNNSNKPTNKKTGRKIGSDERPLETEYYDILGLSPKATPVEIKSAYRRMALKMHPDKNPNDPEAGEKFKSLAIAYNTLSDPQLRKKYNEFGKQQDGADGYVDPEAVFSTLFGGERFQDIIGTLALGEEMKTALQKTDDDDDEPGNQIVSTSTSNPPSTNSEAKKATSKSNLTPEQKAKKDAIARAEAEERKKIRDARVTKLAETLNRKLCLYTEQAEEEFDQRAMESVRQIWEFEKESLSGESFGPELLRTVGSIYADKSKRYITTTAPGGWVSVQLVGGWFHSAKTTAHLLSETVGTIRAAYDVKAAFDEIAKAEAEGGPGLTQEKKRELEELAAKKGLRALFLGAKLEIESVIREVCNRVLSEPNVPKDKLRKRAVALGILGSVYETAADKNGVEGEINNLFSRLGDPGTNKTTTEGT